MRRRAAILLVTSVLLALPRGAPASDPPPRGPVDSPTVPSPASIDSLLLSSRFVEAEAVARQALTAMGSAGASDSLRAAMLDRLARALLGAGRWNDPEALAVARRALRLKESAYGPDHGEVGLSLLNLGWLLYRGGGWEDAMPLAERALTVSERFHGERHRSVVRSLHLLAALCEDAGEFSRADSLYRRELTLTQSLWGAESKEAANTLNSMAVLCRKIGRYHQARSLFERSLAIRERTSGPDHLDVSWSLNNYAGLLGAMGDWTRARAAYERALRIRRKARGPEHPEVALGYNNLGTALSALGDSAGAQAAFEEALAVQEKTLAPDHPDVAQTLKNLGQLWTGLGRPDRARAALERALSIREGRFGRVSAPVAGTIAALGDLHLTEGEAAAAARDFQEALDLEEKLGAPDGERKVEALDGLSRALYAAGEDSAALDAALEAQRLIVERVRLTARVLDERAALTYGGTRSDALGGVLSIAADRPHDGARATRALDALIASRALVLDELAERHRTIRSAQDPEVLRLSDTLRAARERLAHLTVRGPLGSAERHRLQIEAAAGDRERVEAALARRSAEFRRGQARSAAGLDAVAAALGPDDALVAYARHRRLRRSAPGGAAPPQYEYTAFALRGSGASPAVIPLGSARALEAEVAAWRAEATRRPGALTRARDEARYWRAGVALRRRVWDPVAARVAGATRVFVVPDGSLHGVSFAALPDSGDRFLAEAPAAIHLLGADRDLALPPPEMRGRGVLVFGAPDYERADEKTALRFDATAAPASAPPGAALAAAARGDASARPEAIASYRGASSTCEDFAKLRFEPLPAARLELREIAAEWSRADSGASDPVLSLAGAAASESAFKRLAPGRRVLHLATHGFLLGSSCGAVGTRGAPERVNEASSENPLVRCGLALAGANRRIDAPPELEDGVLTAEEIGALDLAGVEWAVLSACETGRGEVRATEGVLGLRRAFQVAGARTVIMSLWPVDDASTGRWMRALYRARRTGSKSTVEAVRDAYRSVLGERRARGLGAHPFYWAGFVAAGDWR